MKKWKLFLLCAFCNTGISSAQTSSNTGDSSLLIVINQQIDDYVVNKDTLELASLYAEDFIFSHGSGRVEGKQGWFSSVAKGGFLLRRHDSVKVELHPQLAILRGKLSVQKRGKEKTDNYYLYYIRVYAYRNKRWQMLSHITTSEYHLPAIPN
ncbi:MAG: nuclear transport factor 2 family protein [Chitinophagaceae bacterium]|nr:nuclear transport factor 2 family protein [Chitinophagaceae bacterium]